MSKKDKEIKKIEKKQYNSLVLFNCQNDYLTEGGAVYDKLEHREGFIDHIVSLIRSYPKVNHIVLVIDDYSKKEPTFIKNGGDDIEHCIHGTTGAAIPNQIIEACKERVGLNGYDIVKIHNNPDNEDVGAFTISNNYWHLSQNEEPQPRHCYFSNASGECGVRFINQHLVFAGVNYYATMEDSIDNLIRSWKFNILVDKANIISDDDFMIMQQCANDYPEQVEFK